MQIFMFKWEIVGKNYLLNMIRNEYPKQIVKTKKAFIKEMNANKQKEKTKRGMFFPTQSLIDFQKTTFPSLPYIIQ